VRGALSRVRRLIGNWLDPLTRAVWVKLDTNEEDRTPVPKSTLPAVRSTLAVYDREQVRLEPAPAKAELRLARTSTELLTYVPLQPILPVLRSCSPGLD
jgi:hypothetical protein